MNPDAISNELESSYQQHRLSQLHQICRNVSLTISDQDPLTIIFILMQKNIPIPGELVGDLIPEFEDINAIVNYITAVNPVLLQTMTLIYSKLNQLVDARSQWITSGSYYSDTNKGFEPMITCLARYNKNIVINIAYFKPFINLTPALITGFGRIEVFIIALTTAINPQFIVYNNTGIQQ